MLAGTAAPCDIRSHGEIGGKRETNKQPNANNKNNKTTKTPPPKPQQNSENLARLKILLKSNKYHSKHENPAQAQPAARKSHLQLECKTKITLVPSCTFQDVVFK